MSRSTPRLGRLCWPFLSLAMAAGCMTAAHAQTTSRTSTTSLLPLTHSGYVGLNVGKPNYPNGCGLITSFTCDDSKASFNIYTGGMFSDYLGMEVGYLNMGNADRAGGTTKAHGVNLSLLGRLPLGSRFSIFAKGGATYGRTSVTADATSGIATGKGRGWGGAYGGGLGFDMAPNSSVVLEWQKHDFHFAGTGRDGVSSTSIGFVQRF